MQSEFKFILPPPVVGCWVIGKTLHIQIQKRPNWLHQKMIKLFFGWEWKDK